MPDNGLRKGRNMQHTCQAQLKQIKVVFDAVIVVYFNKDDFKTKRLEWAGHVIRMDDERIPKIFLMGNSTT